MNSIYIKDIISTIEDIAPLSWQEDYDNSGITLGDIEKECTGVYICLDVSEEIIDKAINSKCNIIISHHPIIFKGIKTIDYYSQTGKILIKAIKNDIVLYAAHTNIDNALNGVNGILAQKIGLVNLRPLSKGSFSDSNNWLGSGAIGELEYPMKKEEFFNHLKKILNLSHITYNSKEVDQIQNIGICGGSGSFLIPDAIKSNLDIFITGEIKYHDLLDNDKSILLAEIGHFESEQFIKERIIAILSEKYCNFVPLISDDSTNRVKYF
ncbi:MAG: Nif3-like dinuclear metal center hexameric protein [Bacteroidales bacterium]|nr:Nif3-like dinuclear metal center hexameric protein [Bacteroidales bacterium]